MYTIMYTIMIWCIFQSMDTPIAFGPGFLSTGGYDDWEMFKGSCTRMVWLYHYDNFDGGNAVG